MASIQPLDEPLSKELLSEKFTLLVSYILFFSIFLYQYTVSLCICLTELVT